MPRLALALPVLLASAPARADDVDLVVIVAVDGLGWAGLDRSRGWLDGGLRRLLDESRVEAEASYRHLNAETGPGHASLATGAPPSVHGIVGNRWFADDGHGGLVPRYCVTSPDPAGGAPVIGGATLAVDTLADRLVAAHPDARVVAVSGKDRAAVLLAGRSPTHAPFWYDKATATFGSSPAYVGDGWQRAARAVVADWDATTGGPHLAETVDPIWRPLPAPPGAADLHPPAHGITRWQLPDLGLGFDHDLRLHPRGWGEALYASPVIDELVLDVAGALLASDEVGLGRGGAPDVLALSFSANDTVSHPFGGESEEALDVLRRLDRLLGALLARLDALSAEGVHVALALSADHGFSPIPEVVRRSTRGPWGGRLPSVDESWEHDPGHAEAFWSAVHPDTVERLDRAVGDALCLPRGVRALHGMEGFAVTYEPWSAPVRTTWERGCPRSVTHAVTHADIDRVLPGVVAALFDEEIEGVLLASGAARWPDGPGADHARHATFPGRSGDAFLLPRPGVVLALDPARGSSHGSHHPYDQHVPLIFWGPDFPAGVHPEPSTPYDLAPTLAGLLGVDLPDATGRDLRAR